MLLTDCSPASVLKRLPIQYVLAALVALSAITAQANFCGDKLQIDSAVRTSIVADRAEIESLFEEIKYSPSALGLGFQISVGPVLGIRDVYVDFDLTPVERTIEHWRFGDSTYLFANIGFRNLKKMGEQINQLVLEHLINSPEKMLRVHFSTNNALAKEHLVNLRRAIHAQVLRKYQERKGYLGTNDLRALMSHALFSDNCDVLYLIENPRPPVNQAAYTLRDLGDKAALTMQLSYFGDRNFFRPSVRGLLSAAGFPIHDNSDLYPFEHRLDEDAALKFRAALDARYSSETAGELVRYVKFAEIARPVHSLVLLRTMQLAQKRGVQNVFAAGDPKTTRLFRLYGFSHYQNLPIESGVTESLTHLEVGSEVFNTVFQKLSADSRNVEIR